MHNKRVKFFYQSGTFTFHKRDELKNFLIKVFKNEKIRLANLNVIFCTDKALLNINRQFLKHNYYTDIVTFIISDSTAIEAEMYISVDRVKDNAKRLDISFKLELHRVILHGILHLAGYNDKSSQQIIKMRKREDHYLRLYFRK